VTRWRRGTTKSPTIKLVFDDLGQNLDACTINISKNLSACWKESQINYRFGNFAQFLTQVSDLSQFVTITCSLWEEVLTIQALTESCLFAYDLYLGVNSYVLMRRSSFGNFGNPANFRVVVCDASSSEIDRKGQNARNDGSTKQVNLDTSMVWDAKLKVCEILCLPSRRATQAMRA
jgi:hypothetical protein